MASLSYREQDAVRAHLKRVRLSPRKARLVADQIRNKPVGHALDTLKFSTKKAAFIMHKLLNSALANAENNNKADIDEFYVSQVTVDEGPTMKRLRPRARGRADQIHKTTSHITLMVAPLDK